jgi:hypothetical protein|tara:strand:+ start:708 stop:878 length:171 start_codon:yes stop_codon:yes gene_type:complete
MKKNSTLLNPVLAQALQLFERASKVQLEKVEAEIREAEADALEDERQNKLFEREAS